MSKSPFLTALFSLRLLVKTVLLLLDWTTAMTFCWSDTTKCRNGNFLFTNERKGKEKKRPRVSLESLRQSQNYDNAYDKIQQIEII